MQEHLMLELKINTNNHHFTALSIELIFKYLIIMKLVLEIGNIYIRIYSCWYI